MTLEIRKNNEYSTKKSLYLDLYINNKKEDFCVIKEVSITRGFSSENEKRLGFLPKSSLISEYFKNKEIENFYREHYKSSNIIEIRVLSFTTDLTKAKIGKEIK